MTPERWNRTEELYHQALARPEADREAFLAVACSDDEAMRRNVESLLDESESDDGFLANPALAIPAHKFTDVVPTTIAGTSLGGYHLEALIGAGGMGEVYRAHDVKLGRDVAIKILPSAFTRNPDRLARFEREARMLAALNHANICAIYGFEEADGVRFLILELVEGETLADQLTHVSSLRANGEGLPFGRVLGIARQIAEALEVAHDKGIVHRDLKPANIKITPDGAVKVLDFGLAKAVRGDGSPPDLSNAPLEDGARREGAVIGTAAYMSPEQTRGLPVDKRTDIWAFGCVLYEMLTGRLAFPAETASDTIAKILEHEPDWSALPPTTPETLRRLLRRCLTKDPKQRLRDMGDARIEIETSDVGPARANQGRAATSVTIRTLTTWLPWVAVAALTIAIGLREVGRLPATEENLFANAQFSRFTDWEGTEGGAHISPDGRFVTFIADHDGEFNLWVSQVGTGRFLNLTRDLPLLDAPRSDSLIRTIGFSGDGAEIWFAGGSDASSPKMLVPLTGGAPRPFLGQGIAAPSWSPDGARLAYFTNVDGDPLSVSDQTGADPHRIVVQPQEADAAFFKSGMHSHNPIWSHDGQWIYFTHGLEPTVETEVWRIRPSGGSPEQLTQQHMAVNSLAMIDSRTLLYTALPNDGSGPRLWALDVAHKVSRRVSSGLERYSSVAASRDGRRIVATTPNPSATLWRMPLIDRPAEDRDVQPYPMPTARALAPRFGGTSLFYLATHGTADALWRAEAGQASQVWTGEDGLSEPAAVSPDGGRVAIVFRHNGKPHLQIMAADGTNARTLAATVDVQGAAGQSTAAWSPDGQWIAVGGSDARGPGLLKVPVNGGEPIRLVTGQASNPVWSPDGTLIVYSGKFVGGVVPLLGTRPDGTPVDMPDVKVRAGGYRFLPNGTGVVYLPRGQSFDFWLLDLTTKTTRPLSRFGNHGSLRTFDITPDGKYIVFDRSRENSDIVLIDLPKQ